MDKIENQINELKNKIDPPERDLLASDVIKFLFKIIGVLIITLILSAASFTLFISFQTRQHNKTIQHMNQQFNEFLTNFEVLNDSYTQDGYGNNIIGDYNTTYGADSKKD